MTIPDPVNRINGMGQAANGYSQGGVGSYVGQTAGPSIGINRAATGGPNMDQSPQRKTSGLFSFLGNALGAVAPIASLIPGVGSGIASGASILGGLMAGNAGQNQINQANAAQQAATAQEGEIAGEMTKGLDLSPLITQEKSAISSAVDNSNAPNPGKLIADLFGGAVTNAISGVAAGRQGALNDAANIYSRIGQGATQAAGAVGNPWTTAADAAQTEVKSGGGGSSQPVTGFGNTTPTATSTGQSGTFDISGGIQPVPSAPVNPYILTPQSNKRGG